MYVAIDVENQLQVAYFATFMMTWGTSAPSVILDLWYNNNIADENKTVMLTSVGVPVANLMGVVSSNIFRPQDEPKYIPALATTAAFGAIGLLLTLVLGAWMIGDNKRRDRRQGKKVRARDVPTELLRDWPAVEEYGWFCEEMRMSTDFLLVCLFGCPLIADGIGKNAKNVTIYTPGQSKPFDFCPDA